MQTANHSLNDLKQIELLLTGLDDVMDCSAWLDESSIRIQVTLHQTSDLSAKSIIEYCKKELGARCTPSSVQILTAHRRAVVRVA